jgi:peptidoglycan/LPS O-acetylase OafA/YrhL
MTATSAPTTTTRYVGLDTLRGLAVLRVVLYHYTTRYHELFGRHGETLDMKPTDFSVPMFFVISGFVIPLTLAKCRSVGDFAFLRVTRLYPTFWLCVAITFVAVAAFGLPGREVTGSDALLNLTMLPKALGGRYVDIAYWTLEVELKFYALMALLMFLRFLDKAALVLLAMAAIHAFAHTRDEHTSILSHAHLFAIGLLLFEIRKGRRPWHLAAFVAVWIIAYLDRGPAYLVWIAAFFGLTSLSIFVDPKIFRIKPLLWFGALSYPLYLLHQNIGYIVLRAADAAGLHQLLGITLALAVMIPLSYAVHRLVEKPAQDWARERWRRSRRRDAEAAGAQAGSTG